MRKCEVYRNSSLVGILTEEDDKTFKFEYDQVYFNNNTCPAVSLTMPKNKGTYKSTYLFPFFANMLAEGVNKQLQLRQFQINEKDQFGLLLATSSQNTIGAVHVKEMV